MKIRRLAVAIIAPNAWTAAGQAPIRTVELETTDGITIYGDVHLPEGDVKLTLLLFHQGGSSARAEYAPIIPRLLESGFACWPSTNVEAGSVSAAPIARSRTSENVSSHTARCIPISKRHWNMGAR